LGKLKTLKKGGISGVNWHVRKFHFIAPFYQLFFKFQTWNYSMIIEQNLHKTGILRDDTLLDIGSGTGAFAKSWERSGLKVLATDAAPGMIKQCRKNGLDCIELDLNQGLPFSENEFQVVSAAYLAHGLPLDQREFLYKESARVAEKAVIFHDFSKKTNPVISAIENMEGSHYREFIGSAPGEMKPFFTTVEVIGVNKWHNWYVCHP